MNNNNKLNILIVEDSDQDLKMILNAIGQSGYDIEISVAENIDDALALSVQKSHDCIFLDYYFPEKNGIDFLKSYISKGGSGSIIMVTSQDDVNMAVECMKLGASDYLTKNQITPASISKSLSYVLKLKQARDIAYRAEQALLESELKLKSIIARSPIILFNIDKDGVFTLFKGKAASNLAIKAEEVIGKSITDLSDKLPIKYEDYRKACREECLNFKTESNNHYFEINYIPVKNELKVITGMMGVAIDITTFKKNEDVLMNTLEETEMTSKIKEQFLANMSHEIRTPIHGIISLTQFVLGTPLNTEQNKYLELIRKSADTLLVIINDILDSAKMDAEKMTFEEVQFNLMDTIQTTVAAFIPKTIEKNIQLKTDFPASLPVNLLGDPVRLTQIINNLLGNAVKFTEKGYVSIGAAVKEKNEDYAIIEFTVRDTGIGIPPHKIGNIFDSFSQAGSDISRKYGGTGLGLSIAKKLILKQQGVLNVESLLDAGTTFTFSIPYKISKNIMPIESNKTVSTIQFDRPLHILVAEDNDINRFIIEKMLKDWGLLTDFAKTGTEAVEMASKNAYDLILMDVEMPDMNGNRATEIIRSEFDIPLKNVPIVAMTGHAMQGEREKCLNCGMNDYISKPFKPEELKEKIHFYTQLKAVTEKEIANEFNGDVSDTTVKVNSDAVANTPTLPPSERLTNMQFLKEISENNEQFFREFIQMFLNNTPKSIAEMKDACEKGDWERVRQAAHKVKPSFNYVGLKELNQISARVEEYAKSKLHLEEIPAMLDKISTVSAMAFIELESEITTITQS